MNTNPSFVVWVIFVTCVGYLIGDTFRSAIWGLLIATGIPLILEGIEGITNRNK